MNFIGTATFNPPAKRDVDPDSEKANSGPVDNPAPPAGNVDVIASAPGNPVIATPKIDGNTWQHCGDTSKAPDVGYKIG